MLIPKKSESLKHIKFLSSLQDSKSSFRNIIADSAHEDSKALHIQSLGYPKDAKLQKINSFDNLGKKEDFLDKNKSKSHSMDISASKKQFLSIYRDPGLKPLCDKGASFDRNVSELPENRLKLLYNQHIIKMRQDAIDRISQKIAQEDLNQLEKNNNTIEFRKKVLRNIEFQRNKTRDLQAKSGLIKYSPMPKIRKSMASPRIEALSIPKPLRRTIVEEFLDCNGFLKADNLGYERAYIAKTVRNPSFRLEGDLSSKCTTRELVKLTKETKEIFSEGEINECMKEINEFHKRYGELKGRVGFPQIDLEKYKKKNN